MGEPSAAAAVQQMAARFASGGGALGILVRDSQDFSAFWRDRDKALVDALSKPEAQRNQTLIDNIRKQIADTEAKLTAIAGRLEKDFPEYAALASPKLPKAEEVQQLLGGDEALVFFLAGDKESYVFVLTRERFDWKTIAPGGDALSQKVASALPYGRSTPTGSRIRVGPRRHSASPRVRSIRHCGGLYVLIAIGSVDSDGQGPAPPPRRAVRALTAIRPW